MESRNQATSPFQSAETQPRRLKALFWGDSGAGKTTLSLQFPAPAVIDLEGGADLYGGSFDFHVLRVNSADEVMKAVQWLGENDHAHRTLVIDPITLYWDAVQKKYSDIFLRRNKGSKGFKFEFYDFQPRDWMTIKAEFKDFIRRLLALDMNVIVTARQKVQYADGAFMRAVGETFDGEKSLPYLFDVVVHLSRDDKGRFLGECTKDRSNKLPTGQFEVSYAVFEKLLDKDNLERPARPTQLATEEQKALIQEHITRLGMTPEQVHERLQAYGAEGLADLPEHSARTILQKLDAANAAGKNSK